MLTHQAHSHLKAFACAFPFAWNTFHQLSSEFAFSPLSPWIFSQTSASQGGLSGSFYQCPSPTHTHAPPSLFLCVSPLDLLCSLSVYCVCDGSCTRVRVESLSGFSTTPADLCPVSRTVPSPELVLKNINWTSNRMNEWKPFLRSLFSRNWAGERLNDVSQPVKSRAKIEPALPAPGAKWPFGGDSPSAWPGRKAGLPRVVIHGMN